MYIREIISPLDSDGDYLLIVETGQAVTLFHTLTLILLIMIYAPYNALTHIIDGIIGKYKM